MDGQRENIWNVPNVLTMIRAALIPVYWALFMRGKEYAALAVFVIASLTDLLDGYIARRYHLITDFGKMMDPAADKLMVFSVMLGWVIRRVIPWPAAAILLGKELLMAAGGMVLLQRHIVSYSAPIGKAAQAMMVGALILCFFGNWFMERVGYPVHLLAIWCAVCLTLCALAYYIRRALRWNRKAKNTK